MNNTTPQDARDHWGNFTDNGRHLFALLFAGDQVQKADLSAALVLQPHSCWPETERAKRGEEVTAFKPFIQFRGCSKYSFAPSFSPEKLQIRELRL